jgi:fatty acid desaturase
VDGDLQRALHRGIVPQRLGDLVGRLEMKLRRPQPENTRRRQELRGPRHALISALVIVAALAIAALVRWSASPVMLPVMLIVLAATQAVAAALLARRYARARLVALAAAFVPIAWGFEQILVVDVVTWFQLVLLGIGALEALLVASCTPRDPPKKPSPRDRVGHRY